MFFSNLVDNIKYGQVVDIIKIIQVGAHLDTRIYN